MFAQSRKGGGRAEGEAEGEDGAETNIHKRKKTKDVYNKRIFLCFVVKCL